MSRLERRTFKLVDRPAKLRGAVVWGNFGRALILIPRRENPQIDMKYPTKKAFNFTYNNSYQQTELEDFDGLAYFKYEIRISIGRVGIAIEPISLKNSGMGLQATSTKAVSSATKAKRAALAPNRLIKGIIQHEMPYQGSLIKAGKQEDLTELMMDRISKSERLS